MGGGSWKVAYADFVTAMMAFFLLMWILNMAPKETLQGLAGVFASASSASTTTSLSGRSNNPFVQYIDKAEQREFRVNETDAAHYAIAQSFKQFLRADSQAASESGLTSDGIGVLLNISTNLMFEPGTARFAPEGEKVLDEVVSVMTKYKVYLVIRGHTDASETGAPHYPSAWDLSAARANAAARYIIGKGIRPTLVRTVSYAATRPLVDSSDPKAVEKNSRVEFNFHRAEVMTTVVGY